MRDRRKRDKERREREVAAKKGEREGYGEWKGRKGGTNGGWRREGARRGKNLEMQHGGRESVAIITKGRQLNANTPGRGRGRPADLVPPRKPRVANR